MNERTNQFRNTIGEHIAAQIANAESPQAAKLAQAMREAIGKLRADGGENHHAFSVDATYEDGDFAVEVSFFEDSTKTIMYSEGSDDATVGAIWNDSSEGAEELCRLAGLMLSKGWVEGYAG